jgi:O-antigen biosynthesis protein
MKSHPDRVRPLRRLERLVRRHRKSAAAWLRFKTRRIVALTCFPTAARKANGRRIVLFLDAQVPTPDQDAGSRSVCCYMEFFLRAGWAVKFMADNFEECQPYTRRLEAMKVEMLVGSYYQRNWKTWLKRNGLLLDAVIISRSQVAKKWAETLRQFTPAPLLYYGHDLLSRSLRRASEQLGDPQFLKSARDHEIAEQAAIYDTDFTYYPSSEEVRLLSRLHPKKRIARLPLYVLDPPQRGGEGARAGDGILFVGGFNHRPNEDAVLWFVATAWPLIFNSWPGCVFHVAGSKPTDKILALASERIHIHGYLPENDLAALHRSCRLAVAPLRYGGGVKGKILQAMHLGTPVVTTPIGAEGLDWLRPTMLACSLENFGTSVAALYGDARRQAELRHNAWDFLEAEFSDVALRTALSPALGVLFTRPGHGT